MRRRKIWAILVLVVSMGLASLASAAPGALTLIVGTSGPDHLSGGNAPDKILAKGGNDTLGGNHSFDVLRGGPGNDRLWGGKGPDAFICGPGHDIIHNNKATGRDRIDASCEVVKG